MLFYISRVGFHIDTEILTQKQKEAYRHKKDNTFSKTANSTETKID